MLSVPPFPSCHWSEAVGTLAFSFSHAYLLSAQSMPGTGPKEVGSQWPDGQGCCPARSWPLLECQGLMGAVEPLGERKGAKLGPVILGELLSLSKVQSFLQPPPSVQMWRMSPLGPLTFFRATNSFSAVALSATSSSYLRTQNTELR